MVKFVIHFGECFVQAIGPRIDVLGPDVTIAHRLLKNHAVSAIGSEAYALFTDAATRALDLPLGDATSLTEDIEGMAEVGTRVIGLAR